MTELPGSEPTGRDGQKRENESTSTSIEDLGNFCLASGEFATAIEYFNKLLDLTGTSEDLKPRRASLLRRLATCYNKIGKCDHALELLDKAFALVSNGEDHQELARIIGERAAIHYRKGMYDLSQADCESAIGLLLGGGRAREIVTLFNCLGAMSNVKGEAARSLDFVRSALSICRVINDRELAGSCLNNLGLACKNLGQFEEAQTYLEEALEIAEEIGQHREKAVRLNNLGIVYSKRGLWRKAYKCWIDAVEILTRIGNRWEITSVYLALGRYHLTFRDFERAEQYYVLAMKESSDNGDLRGTSLSFEYMGDIDLACGRVQDARLCYDRALEIAEEFAPGGDVVVEVKRRQADLELSCGNSQAALELASDALRLATSIRNAQEQACALRSRGSAEFALGEWEMAGETFGKSIDLLSALGERKELGMTYLCAGRLLSSQPLSCDRARSYLSDALAIFEDLSMKYETGAAILGLSGIAAMQGDIAACRMFLDRLSEVFGGSVPVEFLGDIGRIEKVANEQVACLSVGESNDLCSFNAVVARIFNADGQAEKMDLVLDACIDETAAERGLVLLRRSGGLKVVASRNMDRAKQDMLLPAIERMHALAGASKRPLVSASVDKDERLTVDAGMDVVCGAVLCVPLLVGEESGGCIYLDTESRGKFFSKAEVEFVVALGDIVKNVISGTRVQETAAKGKLPGAEFQAGCNVEGIITRNRRMLEILEAVKFLARTPTTVLVEGETGTGKEMLARAIHLRGDRKEKPFVRIDCSALSNEIIESELFGHVKGAFTDARVDRAGLFETAEGGTVFLDEIDKTSKKFQERLLQIVDKREFKPVGSSVSRKVDFRLICATNKDLAREVEEGRFLEDLYYRLKVISLRLPPLRERRDDIPLLGEHFLQLCCAEQDKVVEGLSATAMDLLVSYSWPGNVRQLQHEIERAVTFVEDGEAVSPDLFSDELRDWGRVVGTDGGRALSETIQQIERQMIKEALRRYNGNKSKVARNLGLSRRGLLNKIQRYHISS